jgi:hypothetical protein
MYVKLIAGNLVYPPNICVRAEGTVVGYPMRTDLLIEDGFKELEDVEQPDNIRLWKSEWVENETTIEKVWSEREPTEEEIAIDLRNKEERLANNSRIARTEALKQAYRDTYANATSQLCMLAEIPVVRVLDLVTIQTIVLPLLETEYAGRVNGILTLLTNLEMKLVRLDGEDALERV